MSGMTTYPVLYGFQRDQGLNTPLSFSFTEDKRLLSGNLESFVNFLGCFGLLLTHGLQPYYAAPVFLPDKLGRYRANTAILPHDLSNLEWVSRNWLNNNVIGAMQAADFIAYLIGTFVRSIENWHDLTVDQRLLTMEDYCIDLPGFEEWLRTPIRADPESGDALAAIHYKLPDETRLVLTPKGALSTPYIGSCIIVRNQAAHQPKQLEYTWLTNDVMGSA